MRCSFLTIKQGENSGHGESATRYWQLVSNGKLLIASRKFIIP